MRHPSVQAAAGAWEALEGRILFAFDPSPREQESLELLNRMRMQPTQELPLLLNSRDRDIQGGLTVFEVDRTTLSNQWKALKPVAPLAWNQNLRTAAIEHNARLRDEDAQSHQLPGEGDLAQRLRDAGYNFSYGGENVFSFSKSMIHAHAGMAIDWGIGPSGIQNPPDHRVNMMDARFREAGISVLKSLPGFGTGPFLVTQNFGFRGNQGNPFLLGVVYRDNNSDGRYNAGEGVAGVDVEISGSGGRFTTKTMTAGGYQMQVPRGVYTVEFSGGTGAGGGTGGVGGLSGSVFRTVEVAGENVKVDFAQPKLASAPPRLDRAGRTSLAYGGAGKLHLAYYDSTQGLMKYATRTAKGVWSAVRTVDSHKLSGGFLSLDVDARDLPGIAYYDSKFLNLKYAHFNGTAWEIEVVDTGGDVGTNPSLAYDAFGVAGISYYDKTHERLKFAVKRETGWTIRVVDATGVSGKSSGAGIDPTSGGWAVAYSHDSDGKVNYAVFDEKRGQWITRMFAITNDGARNISLAEVNGLPSVSYFDVGEGSLEYASLSSSGGFIQKVASGAQLSGTLSVDPKSRKPNIVYYRANDDSVNRALLTSSGWQSVKLFSGGGSKLGVAQGPKALSYAWLDTRGKGLQVGDL